MSPTSEPSGLWAAVTGQQRKATIILIVSPLLMLAWKYFGSPRFYVEMGLPQWPDGAYSADPSVAAAAYSFAACLLLLGIVPALMVKFVFRERLADYGVGFGDRRRTLRSMSIWVPVFVLLAYLSSSDPSLQREYPIGRNAGASTSALAIHALTYLLYYVGWEFHFRGFLQFGLRARLGDANALLVQVMASGLMHIGKPPSEAFASLAGGILWGLVAYRTKSLLSGLVQHATLGIALDAFLCVSPYPH